MCDSIINYFIARSFARPPHSSPMRKGPCCYRHKRAILFPLLIAPFVSPSIAHLTRECRSLLSRSFANDPSVTGPIGALRCVALRSNGEVIEVIETRRLAEGQG